MFEPSIKVHLASRKNTSCIIINIILQIKNEWQVWTYFILSEKYLAISFQLHLH